MRIWPKNCTARADVLVCQKRGKIMETKKKQFKMPHTFVIIGIIILLAVLLTWIIPAGSYTRFENEAGIKGHRPQRFQLH